MAILRDNKFLNEGKSMCELEDVTKILKVEVISKKKYYSIQSVKELDFSCDMEGIKCKLIKVHE